MTAAVPTQCSSCRNINQWYTACLPLQKKDITDYTMVLTSVCLAESWNGCVVALLGSTQSLPPRQLLSTHVYNAEVPVFEFPVQAAAALGCTCSDNTWCWLAAKNVTRVGDVLAGRVSDYCSRHAQRTLAPCEAEWAVEEGCCSATCWKALNTVGSQPWRISLQHKADHVQDVLYCCTHCCTAVLLWVADQSRM
jgi:hypothetical protein